MTENTSPQHLRIIRRPVVLDRLGVCSSQLTNLVRDAGFPPPIKLGARAAGWLECEVDRWIAQRVAASRSPAAKKPKPFGRHAKRASGTSASA